MWFNYAMGILVILQSRQHSSLSKVNGEIEKGS